MMEEIQKEMERAYRIHRQMSAAFLQRKFKLCFDAARTICDEFMKKKKMEEFKKSLKK